MVALYKSLPIWQEACHPIAGAADAIPKGAGANVFASNLVQERIKLSTRLMMSKTIFLDRDPDIGTVAFVKGRHRTPKTHILLSE